MAFAISPRDTERLKLYLERKLDDAGIFGEVVAPMPSAIRDTGEWVEIDIKAPGLQGSNVAAALGMSAIFVVTDIGLSTRVHTVRVRYEVITAWLASMRAPLPVDDEHAMAYEVHGNIIIAYELEYVDDRNGVQTWRVLRHSAEPKEVAELAAAWGGTGVPRLLNADGKHYVAPGYQGKPRVMHSTALKAAQEALRIDGHYVLNKVRKLIVDAHTRSQDLLEQAAIHDGLE